MADTQPPSGVSIVVPTYQERDNLPELIKQIATLKTQLSPLELIIVDDDSQDGTAEYIQTLRLTYDWLVLITRKNKRELSSAVVDGLTQAHYDILVCMDGDLSHPIHVIPQMVKCIQQNNIDFVIGSRFAKGGSIDKAWPVLRKLNACFAKLLAKPFVTITDPMSGFFCLKKTTFLAAEKLDPIGYKIGLELMVKCHCNNIVELPIHFAERIHGYSKLNMQERLNYLVHIIKLLKYKFFT